MLKFTAIGNLGADARIEDNQGRKFVSFNVGHNDRYTDQNGQVRESTTWISCALNGDGGNLLPYLTKGKLVYVEGRGSVRVYSSPTLRKMVAGVNISVDRIELLPSSTDVVPRHLVDADGALHNVNKAFYLSQQEAKELGAKKNAPALLLSPDNRQFTVDDKGWISPVPAQTPQQNEEADAANQQ